MSQRTVHVPVMLREVLQELRLQPGLTVMDGTVGAAGHSSKILTQIGSEGRLLGFDRDPMMLGLAGQQLDALNVSLFHASYSDAANILAENNISGVDRVLLDLGLSSDQLADRDRGFGFDAGGSLDMRFDVSCGNSVAEFLATASDSEIETVLREYGEERFAASIAQAICRTRTRQPIRTTQDLERCVSQARRSSARGGTNPATRTFQALRIAVNRELEHVERMMLEVLPEILNPGGIAVIITFHSLEDRIVKNAFKGQKLWTALTRKPIASTPAEIRLNPRSRSAKLRAAQQNP